MMYKFNDIEKVVCLSGFELRNSTGSHHVYLHKMSGITVTVPKHPAGVSVGVGDKVIKTCVLCARISNVNIGKEKLPKDIHDIIINHHKKCKENLLFLIPEEYRSVNKIESAKDVNKYLKYIKQNYAANNTPIKKPQERAM